MRITLPICLFFLLAGFTRAEGPDYEKQIAPIFEEHCIDCHGPDTQEAGLRLDRRALMLKGGDSGLASLVPGKPQKSHLIERITAAAAAERMPPESDPIPLEQKELISEWIVAGAEWPGQMNDRVELATDHWSFQPVKRPEAPTGSHPIDAFLNRSLSQMKLTANMRATPEALIRRASIIVTGLPPTPERVQEFVAASAKDADTAWVNLVDELLASPHFGERWAQHWLDVIRWSESNGSEANLYRKNAWFYRDYVVRAFNSDLPYDQFITEQIAGDSTGAGDAMGFLVAGPHVPAATVGQEPTAIRQARADRMDEIIQTVGTSVLGLTMGCARCHNHKFDPVSISDYYSLAAVFQDIEFGSRLPEFAKDHPRAVRSQELREEIARRREVLRKSGGWEENWGAWKEFHFRPFRTKSVRIQFKTPYVGIDEIEIYGPEDPDRNLGLAVDGVTVSGPDEMVADGRNKITRINDGEYGTMAWRARAAKDSKDRPYAILTFPEPTVISSIRLSSNREYNLETDYLEKKPGFAFRDYEIHRLKDDGEWQNYVGTWWVNNKVNRENAERAAEVNALQQVITKLQQEGPQPAFVGRLVRPVVTHVFHRGSPENPRDEVPPAAPKILNGGLGLNSSSTGAQRRAEFARWVVDPANPLTARVMVNRVWSHVFGTGIVATSGDFGKAGATASHPELLDWLASEFVTPKQANVQPWSTKSLLRLLLTSNAFQRSSLPQDGGLAADAQARLLWRYPPKRVEAEVIRDSILQASGKLDLSMGGIGYRIHNIKKTYAQWEVVDNHGPHTWRRMLYQERMRRVDDRLFTAFDFPDCGQVRPRRPISTTPLQALNLLNSDFVVEQSKLIAERAQQDSPDDAESRCFELILGRVPDADELAAAKDIAADQGLNIVCRSLLNANEFAFLP